MSKASGCVELAEQRRGEAIAFAARHLRAAIACLDSAGEDRAAIAAQHALALIDPEAAHSDEFQD